jgi:glutathione S-transferase
MVWESNTIVRYLAASRGRTDLLPTQPAARAHAEQWMDWQGSDFNNSWRVVFQGLVRKHPSFQDPKAIDAQLGRTRGYIAGDTFTVADIAIGLSLRRWHSIPMSRPSLPNVERYYERLLARSGFQRYGRDGGP